MLFGAYNSLCTLTIFRMVLLSAVSVILKDISCRLFVLWSSLYIMCWLVIDRSVRWWRKETANTVYYIGNSRNCICDLWRDTLTLRRCLLLAMLTLTAFLWSVWDNLLLEIKQVYDSLSKPRYLTKTPMGRGSTNIFDQIKILTTVY